MRLQFCWNEFRDVYYKKLTIVSDACTLIVFNLSKCHQLRSQVTAQFGASLTDEASNVIYDRNMLMIQAEATDYEFHVDLSTITTRPVWIDS